MRNALLLGARMIVGGYLAVHGAQKLFGAFGGPGLDKAAAGFERIGLAPGRQMAALAAAGPGRFRAGPSLPRPLPAAAAAIGGVLAASSLAKMISSARAASTTQASPPAAEAGDAAGSSPGDGRRPGQGQAVT